MYAVILTGGKQYRVKEGDVLSVEKLDLEPGRKAHFDHVLLIEDGENVHVGTPVLENAMVRARSSRIYKDEKVLVFKKKRRKQYRRTRGHRQQLTKVRIDPDHADRTLITAQDLRRGKAGSGRPRTGPPPEAEGGGPGRRPRRPPEAGQGQAAKAKPAKKAAPKPKAVGKKKAAAREDQESDQGVSHGP